MFKGLLIASVVLSTGLGWGQNAPVRVSGWTVCGNIKPADVIVQSHRGAGVLAPENTVEAFELGWKLHTYPEADVRMTSDGVIVAFHDKDFSRVVFDAPPELKPKGVEDLTWAEVEKLRVGAEIPGAQPRQVSMLEELLRLMIGRPERLMYLDIKKVDFEALAALVKQLGVEKQVILASPRHDELVLWRRLVPEGKTLLWIGGKTEEEIVEKFQAAKERKFQDLTQVQIHTRIKGKPEDVKRMSVDPFMPSDKFLIQAGDVLRGYGVVYQTLTYGGRSKDITWKVLDLGLMALATDYPNTVRAEIEEYCNEPREQMRLSGKKRLHAESEVTKNE